MDDTAKGASASARARPIGPVRIHERRIGRVGFGAGQRTDLLIVCGMPAFADGLAAWLDLPSRGWSVGAVCADLESGRRAGLARFAVVIATDDVRGDEVAWAMTGAGSRAHLLAIGAMPDVAREVQLVRAGAGGVIGLDSSRDHAVAAVATLLGGGAVVSGPALRVLASRDPGSEPQAELTPRQRQVLALLAEGLSTREIAARLLLSPSTVKTHLSRLASRVGVPGQRALAVNAGAILTDEPARSFPALRTSAGVSAR